jgi:parvulin-like peptidyl-prolyl isomerase
MRTSTLFSVLLLAAGCEQAKSKLDAVGAQTAMTEASTPCAPSAPGAPPTSITTPKTVKIDAKDIDSHDILDRTETFPEVTVKHVLLAWKELDAATYHGRIDKRAKDRTNAEAAQLAQDYAAQLRADPSKIDALVKQFSEDPGAQSGDPYTVKTDTAFVPEFKKLALRLKEKEVGIVKTSFGYHVIERVAPPPPDPLESADILARQPDPGPVQVQHVLIGWKDVPAAKRGQDPRAKDRTKEQADAIAKDVLAKARGNADFVALMKESSEDPGSKDNGKIYPVSGDAQMVEPFKNLSLRLKMGEVGIVKSPFGWHIIKRVPPPPPPPPDPLDSTEILKREPPAAKVKVKHILLGWTDAHTSDPRGTARTRADLEKLVKSTVDKLKKGDKIEPLMKELSEDPGSQDGKDYDVSPTAGMVPPFTNLSLRLKVGEVGTVKTDFGIHIIKRTE